MFVSDLWNESGTRGFDEALAPVRWYDWTSALGWEEIVEPDTSSELTLAPLRRWVHDEFPFIIMTPLHNSASMHSNRSVFAPRRLFDPLASVE